MSVQESKLYANVFVINKFKYISCVGSSIEVTRYLYLTKYLNTSHVSVQAKLSSITSLVSLYLNTSHVSVQGARIN